VDEGRRSSGAFGLDDSLRSFLDRLAAQEPGPRGGSAAALTAAMAASISLVCAERSPGSGGIAVEAGALRKRAEALAIIDAEAYAQYLEAVELHDDAALGAALEHAADAPLQIAEVASDTAQLAAGLAEHCEPALQADAVAASLLAEAAARAAGNLVAVNLSVGADDPRVRRAKQLVADATAAAERAWRRARETP
jgi:formiminotetrahydrofolate cyclodeaminase